MSDAWKTYIHLPPMPDEVFADPGRHGWYFRGKKPDSVARFVRDDLPPTLSAALEVPEVKALVEAATEVGRISDRDHVAWRRLNAALAALKGGA